MKKIFVGFLTLGAVLTILPMFAAFEAHVINVTARIENALAVTANELNFGTVFPQEHLEKPLTIGLSGSFRLEDRAQSVDYFIRQKPKCAVTSNNGTIMLNFPTATGHIVPDSTIAPEGYRIECGDAPANMPTGATWGVLPSLCEYISKEGENGDGSLPSFHQPWTVDGDQINWTDVSGRLNKETENLPEDLTDTWTIDLAVPCFGGYCAQDWADFVHRINPDPNVNPSDYTQPIENEHRIFGCDLWVEVSGVNNSIPENPTPDSGDNS